MEFAIDDNTFDRNQIKELLSITKKLVDERVALGKTFQKKRNQFIPMPPNDIPVIPSKVLQPKQSKSKKYNRVELFNDNRTDDFICMSCGEPIVGTWIFKHQVDGQYQCWHPDNKCIPIQRLTEFITRPKYKLYLAENRSEIASIENDDIDIDDD